MTGVKPYTVYTAGPIAGCDWDGAVDWRNWVEEQLPECDVRSPMRGKDFLKRMHHMPDGQDFKKGVLEKKAKTNIDAAISSQHAIVVRDHWDVTKADILFVNLLASKELELASIGTSFELAWAWEAQKPAIVVMQAKGNPNDHPFIREAAYAVVESLEEAVFISRQLLNLPLVL